MWLIFLAHFPGIFRLLFIFCFDYRVGTGCVEICDKTLFFGRKPKEQSQKNPLFFSSRINVLCDCLFQYQFTHGKVRDVRVYNRCLFSDKRKFHFAFLYWIFHFVSVEDIFYSFWLCFEGLSKSKQTKIRSWFMCTLLNLNKFASYRSHTRFHGKAKANRQRRALKVDFNVWRFMAAKTNAFLRNWPIKTGLMKNFGNKEHKT